MDILIISKCCWMAEYLRQIVGRDELYEVWTDFSDPPRTHLVSRWLDLWTHLFWNDSLEHCDKKCVWYNVSILKSKLSDLKNLVFND